MGKPLLRLHEDIGVGTHDSGQQHLRHALQQVHAEHRVGTAEERQGEGLFRQRVPRGGIDGKALVRLYAVHLAQIIYPQGESCGKFSRLFFRVQLHGLQEVCHVKISPGISGGEQQIRKLAEPKSEPLMIFYCFHFLKILNFEGKYILFGSILTINLPINFIVNSSYIDIYE